MGGSEKEERFPAFTIVTLFKPPGNGKPSDHGVGGGLGGTKEGEKKD